jgi:cob(I)alamin adenosyltransferase
VEWLEGVIESYERRVEVPKDFILSGDSLSGAAFDLARTIVRRAEREISKIHLTGEEVYPFHLRYVNRLSALCFILVLWENQQASDQKTSLAKGDQE